jgi:hypothetical protein
MPQLGSDVPQRYRDELVCEAAKKLLRCDVTFALQPGDKLNEGV